MEVWVTSTRCPPDYVHKVVSGNVELFNDLLEVVMSSGFLDAIFFPQCKEKGKRGPGWSDFFMLPSLASAFSHPCLFKKSSMEIRQQMQANGTL